MIKNSITQRFKVFRINRKIIHYGVCVAIASVLWILNTLNKDYTEQLTYPVKYTDFPQEAFLISDPPQKITLEVKANGFTLLAHRLQSSLHPLSINISTYSKHSAEDDDLFKRTLYLKDLKEKIGSQLRSDITPLAFQPEKIEFTFSPAVSKKIAIYPAVHYNLKPQHILKDGILCTPDSIWVNGSSQIMDTLSYIYTEYWDAGEIKKDRTQTLLLKPMKGVQFEQKEIKIEMCPERYTEVKRIVPIQVLNLPDSLELRRFPRTVEITYDIGLSRYNSVTDSDFVFSVDYKETNASSFLRVQRTHIPRFIKNLKHTPLKVEFIIEKKYP